MGSGKEGLLGAWNCIDPLTTQYDEIWLGLGVAGIFVLSMRGFYVSWSYGVDTTFFAPGSLFFCLLRLFRLCIMCGAILW
jgi:hypothetical protein